MYLVRDEPKTQIAFRTKRMPARKKQVTLALKFKNLVWILVARYSVPAKT